MVLTEGGVALLGQIRQLGGVVWVTALGDAQLAGEGVPGETAELSSGRVLRKRECNRLAKGFKGNNRIYLRSQCPERPSPVGTHPHSG